MENKEKKRPLLSICIPTYNRGNVLKQVLEKYVSAPDFDDAVELVISDNASTDNTQQIVEEFAKHRENIKYHRNEVNIVDRNFPLVLDIASGEYLKLMNDCLYPLEGGLAYMKSKIREHIEDRRALFFTLDYIYTKRKAEEIECRDLDEYIQSISTYVTCNNCFGAWREQWADVKEREKYSKYKLLQDDWSYQIVANNGGCVLYDRKLFGLINQLGVRKGYNWFEVHLDNYYKILQPYVQKGLVKESTIKQDKKYLINHFRPELVQIYILHTNRLWKFDTSHTLAYFWKYYKKEPVFYLHLLLYPFALIYYPIKLISKKALKSLLGEERCKNISGKRY